MKLKKYEFIIIIVMAAVIFVFLNSMTKTPPHEEQAFVPLKLDRMNLDDSGRYLEPLFGNVTIDRDIVYSTAENEGAIEDLTMDIYRPEGDREASRPLIIWVHGGGFTGGDKSGAETICTDLARRGFVCASINYRLKKESSAEWDQIKIDTETDTISALSWLRGNCEQYGIDKNRIFLAGDSAGGCIALNTGFTDAPLQQDSDRGGIIGIIDIYGSDLWRYTDVNDPPVLIIHGTVDTVVSYEVSRSLAQTFESAGHQFDFVTMYGIGHDYMSDYDEVLASMTCFIYNRLQFLNGTPFEYNRKTLPIGQDGTMPISLSRSGTLPGFKGTVRITPPAGWSFSGVTNITGQDELEFVILPPAASLSAGMKLAYFDFLDESGRFVSRITVPVQVVNPAGTQVK